MLLYRFLFLSDKIFHLLRHIALGLASCVISTFINANCAADFFCVCVYIYGFRNSVKDVQTLPGGGY
jgi:hypothetical protein